MKTTKLISILIFLAILSFSCKEEINDGEDDEIQTQGIAADYMFQENKTYIYEVTKISEDSLEKGIFNLKIFANKEIHGKNAQHLKADVESNYFTLRDIYIYNDEDKIFGLSAFLNLLTLFDIYLVYEFQPLEDMSWNLCFDFSNPEFESEYYNLVGDENFEESEERVEIISTVKCKGINEISYTFDGQTDNAKEFTLTQNILIIEENKNFGTDKLEMLVERKVTFMKGVGIVEEEVNSYHKHTFKDGDTLSYSNEGLFNLKSIK